MTAPTTLIIGAGGALGRAVACRAAREDSHLLLVDLDDKGLQRTEDLARERSETRVNSLVLDAGSPSAGNRLCTWLSDMDVDKIDRFVYSAGITGPVAPIGSYPASAFEDVIRVNLLAPFTLLSALLPLLVEGSDPAAVLVGSTSSIRGRSGLSGYVASKHGLLGLVRSAALDLVGGPIRLNAVLPGPIDTPMLDHLNEMASHSGHSFGRVSGSVTPTATPDEVARVIGFLLSPDARHVHGAGWVVDGAGTVG